MKNAALKVFPKHDQPAIAPHVTAILEAIGEDPRRNGLAETPERVQKSLQYLTSGYNVDPGKIIGRAIYPVTYEGMVVVKDIEFFSLCEHHMLPFFGKIHVAYLPKSKVVGLSKIPRLVDVFARRLQIQERLTEQIAAAIDELIDPAGVGVLCEARHFCMAMRGVQKQSSVTTTSTLLGSFRSLPTRSEFLSLVRGI